MSKPYMLAYDLDNPGQKYDSLKKCIENDISDGWCHYLESTYLFKSNLSASEILNKLEPFLDQNDHLYVSEIVPSNTNGWLNEDQHKFIKDNIKN